MFMKIDMSTLHVPIREISICAFKQKLCSNTSMSSDLWKSVRFSLRTGLSHAPPPKL